MRLWLARRSLPDRCWKQTHVPDSFQCFTLINDVQRALAPQPAGIHRFIKIIGHVSLDFWVPWFYTTRWHKTQVTFDWNIWRCPDLTLRAGGLNFQPAWKERSILALPAKQHNLRPQLSVKTCATSSNHGF
jgi:hypothetical protein